MWMQILGVLAAIALIWWLVVFIKNNPKALSGENLNKSFFSMGVLALILIVFIAILVFILRH